MYISKIRQTKFVNKYFLGKVDDEDIFLSAPSWDCSWYWGFGYLGNNNCHYHLDGLSKDKNLYDAIKEHFGDTLCKQLKDDKNLWTFCELIRTFYTLKETAEVLGRGGSHYTTNPIKDLLIDKKKTDEINNKILPALFDEIDKILSGKVKTK